MIWEYERLGELREALADQLTGLFHATLSNDTLSSNDTFLLTAAGEHLSNAILAMSMAARENYENDRISDLKRQIASGDVAAYDEMKRIMEALRVGALSEKADATYNAAKWELITNMKRSVRIYVRFTAFSLNVLGLVILLLKDLPFLKGNALPTVRISTPPEDDRFQPEPRGGTKATT